VMSRKHGWLLCAVADAALCGVLAALLDLLLLYAVAALSFPLWAWVDSRPEGRAFIDRLFGR